MNSIIFISMIVVFDVFAYYINHTNREWSGIVKYSFVYEFLDGFIAILPIICYLVLGFDNFEVIPFVILVFSSNLLMGISTVFGVISFIFSYGYASWKYLYLNCTLIESFTPMITICSIFTPLVILMWILWKGSNIFYKLGITFYAYFILVTLSFCGVIADDTYSKIGYFSLVIGDVTLGARYYLEYVNKNLASQKFRDYLYWISLSFYYLGVGLTCYTVSNFYR